MPGLHSAISKPLFILEGLVKTTGGANNLAKGQFAIVTDKATTDGLKVVSNFAGLPKDAPIKFRVGRNKLPSNLRSSYAPNYETSWFKTKDIVSVTANFPKFTKRTFDELIVGYDGINDDTKINLAEGQTTILDVIISGDPVGVYTSDNQYTIKVHFGREVGESNQEAVNRAVDRLRAFKIPAGRLLTDLIDVSVIDSSNTPLAGTAFVFSTLNVVDRGDSNALALVQSQYSYQVVKTNINLTTGTTEYTILHPASVSLASFSRTVVDASVKGCADCLPGYNAIARGVVYQVKLEDDGVNQFATVDDLPGFVAGTSILRGRVDGFGTYSVVVTADLTDAQIATFLAINNITGTAEVKRIGTIEEVCTKTTTTTTAWVAGKTCFATTEQYKIQLKDTECGTTRLAELQSYYPSLVIEAGTPTGQASRNVTVSTDGVSLVIIVNGVTYTTVDAGTTTQTAESFVNQHAAAILADTGIVVTSATAVITFAGAAEGYPSIASEAQTVTSLDYLTTSLVGGCQTVYSTTVATNIVCDECSNIFLDNFTSTAPSVFNQTFWTKIVEVADVNAKMGIRLKGKPFDLFPTETTRDSVPFYETSTRISVAGGYLETLRNFNFEPMYDTIFSVKRLSTARDRDALGYNFLVWEDVSRAHYLGETRNVDNQFAKANFGEESLLKFNAQYVTYEITFNDTSYSQSAGGRSGVGHSVMLVTEFGYHAALETLVNALAAKAGVDTVNPTAN